MAMLGTALMSSLMGKSEAEKMFRPWLVTFLVTKIAFDLAPYENVFQVGYSRGLCHLWPNNAWPHH